MELFLPGLLVLLVSAFFVFLVLPRMGAPVLATMSIITVIAVLAHHYAMFGSEYRLSTWQNSLSAYTPFIVLGLAILIVGGVVVSLFTGKSTMEVIQTPIETLQSGITASLHAMPSAASATNALTSAINSGINATKNRNKSLIPALGYRASNV
jgi:hypothetical protein